MSTVVERSEIMRRVCSTNTKPELIVRRLIHSLGFRYRLHKKDLPGKPDLVFSSKRKVIFVNGCFWHGHSCKRGNRLPKKNRDYWTKKIGSNKHRDKNNTEKLIEAGWSVLTIWECETKDQESLRHMIVEFLNE